MTLYDIENNKINLRRLRAEMECKKQILKQKMTPAKATQPISNSLLYDEHKWNAKTEQWWLNCHTLYDGQDVDIQKKIDAITVDSVTFLESQIKANEEAIHKCEEAVHNFNLRIQAVKDEIKKIKNIGFLAAFTDILHKIVLSIRCPVYYHAEGNIAPFERPHHAEITFFVGDVVVNIRIYIAKIRYRVERILGDHEMNVLFEFHHSSVESFFAHLDDYLPYVKSKILL